MTQSSGLAEMTSTYVNKVPDSEEEGWMKYITQQWTLPQKTAVRYLFPTASVAFPTVSHDDKGLLLLRTL